MKTLYMQQSTPEWHQARCGYPSASNFDKIITTAGQPSKQAEKYMYRLAVERITGKPTEGGYQSPAMQRGLELEAEARNYYEFVSGNIVEQVGMCMTEGESVSVCSPDGLIKTDGGLEIKCPEAETHVQYLLDGVLPSTYFQQVQGSLYVTGRKYWIFMSYFPDMRPLILRVERDEKFIKTLSVELELFNFKLAELVKKLQ